MKHLPYIALLLLLSSCYTQKKAERQVIKAQANYPEVVAGLCADMYPPIEFIKDSFIYLPGKVLPPRIDTVEIDCDSVKSTGVVRVKIPCPPCVQKAPDTIAIVRHTQVANTARIRQLELQLNGKDQQLSEQKAEIAVLNEQVNDLQGDKRRLWMWLVIIGIYTVAKLILKQIPAVGWLAKWLI